MSEDDVDSSSGAAVDPHQWLEDDTSEVEQWVSQQNSIATSQLHAPARDHLSTRIGSLKESTSTATSDDDDAATDDTGTESGSPSVVWSYPSPDGSMVARVLDDSSASGTTIRIGDSDENVVTERTAGPRVPPPLFAWTTHGFYYVDTREDGETAHIDKSIRYVDLDGPDRVVTTDIEPTVWPHLRTDDSTGRLLVTMSDEATSDDLYVLTDGTLEPVIVDRSAEFKAFPEDGTVYILTTFDAPRKRVLACPVDELADTTPSEMHEVVPETDGVIETLSVMDDWVVVHRLVDASSEVAVYDATAEANLVSTFEVPPFSAVSSLSSLDDGERCSFQVEGFDRPRGRAHGDLSTGHTELPDRPDSGLPDLAVTREWVDSTDGADVPVFVVHRSDLDPNGDAPTLLHGYGAHRVNVVPTFDASKVPFLEAGGVYAQVCARGGGEFGEQWHRDGMRALKQHTFDDFAAAAEHLIDTGYTSPDHLGIHGHSSGGLAVGAVVTQRPELFAAAVLRAPLLDMLRFHRFPHGEAMTVEFGSPDDEGAYRYLREYSPYHNVAERDYPAVLFCVDDDDPRVHPSHARKTTARLRERARSHPERPILLRTYEDSDHALSDLEVDVDVWTFLFDQLDLRRPSKPS